MVTEDQKAYVKETWCLVKTSGPLEERGNEMFLRLFQESPHLLRLYPFREDNTHAKRVASERVKSHGLKVMTAIDQAIEGLDDMDTTTDFFKELGIKHLAYGATKGHFEHVGAALLWTLETCLGDRWIPDVKDSWVALFGAITEVMGAELPE